MNLKKILLLGSFFVVTSNFSVAQTTENKLAANGAKSAVILNATSERINPGRKESDPYTTYQFKMVWRSTTKKPVSFFWKGQEIWKACDVKILSRHKDEQVKKGDTILLTTIPNGKFPMPESVAKLNTPSIVVKTINNDWLYIPVKKITKKASVNMP